MQTNDDTIELIRSLECEMHREETRKGPARLEELLHPEFCEFGRSGKVYSREDILAEFSASSEFPRVEASDFVGTPISDDVVLLTYVSGHRSDSGELHRRTLRSSVWIRHGTRWRLRFHQGTPADAEH